MKRVAQVLKRWSTDQLITGIEIQEWTKLLANNQWKVDPTYFHRAAWITGWSLPATMLGRVEDARFGRQLASTSIDPTPIFLIGHWRSGTTHLHNLMGRVPGHTYSTVFQVVFPTSFLTTEPFLPQLTAGMMDETRSYDNVKQGWYEAAEDEIALAKLTGLSPYISFMFPEHAARYEKYVDFIECTTDEKKQWKDAFSYFLKKIMLQTGGDRVVVKSCTHTARIRLLLEMFPDAKFIHIHRHPFRVFNSTMHMRSHTDWENFFQLPEEGYEGQRAEQTLLLGERIFERVVEDRHLIPEGNYYELAYDDLVGNEVAVMKDIFEKLDLPNWGLAEPAIAKYVEGLGDYKVNDLPQLDKNTRERVIKYWYQAFEAFGYSPDSPDRVVKPALGQPLSEDERRPLRLGSDA